MAILIKNGTIIDPSSGETRENQELYIENGKITDEKPNNPTIIDATGQWITPGLIDIHCHLRDPGFTDKEDLITGSASAVAGGYTTLCPMANTRPTADNLETLEYIQLRAEKYSKVQILQHVAVTKNLMSKEMTDMRTLWEAGAVAFSDDGLPYEDLGIFKKALQYAAELGAVVVSHAEDLKLAAGGCIREGAVSLDLGVKGIPAEAETCAVAREIEVLRHVPGAHLHFSHISTKESVEVIRRAKADGLNVTAETSPHHLTLLTEAVSEHGTRAKMNPPLGNQADQDAVTQGVLDGTLTALGTDHAPHTVSEKSRPLEDAPFGITGFETALPLYLEKFYHSGLLGPAGLIALLTTKAAECLHIKRDLSIEPGKDAYITIINPDLEWIFTEDQTHSKAVNSPFYGRQLKGRATHTIVNGELEYSLGV